MHFSSRAPSSCVYKTCFFFCTFCKNCNFAFVQICPKSIKNGPQMSKSQKPPQNPQKRKTLAQKLKKSAFLPPKVGLHIVSRLVWGKKPRDPFRNIKNEKIAKKGHFSYFWYGFTVSHFSKTKMTLFAFFAFFFTSHFFP